MFFSTLIASILLTLLSIGTYASATYSVDPNKVTWDLIENWNTIVDNSTRWPGDYRIKITQNEKPTEALCLTQTLSHPLCG